VKGEFTINSDESLEAYIADLRAIYAQGHYVVVKTSTGRQRTPTQSKSLHLWCGQVAEALNDAGLDFRVFLKDGIDVPWTKLLVKEYIWRIVQKAITDKDSTIDPDRDEYVLIYDVLNLKLAEHGITVPWPSKEREK